MKETVQLYLVRHASAASRGPDWPDDGLRPLTDRGIARFRRVVKGLAALEPEIDEVLTSPLVRARQTAELLAVGLDGHPPVRVLDALAPGHPPGQLISAIGTVTRRERLALVGHEPDLGLLAAFLIGAGRAIPLKKGGVCRIDIGSPTAECAGTLVWLATPGMLRRLRRS